MLIVDGQIHLWEKGTPSAHHRQQPYSAEQAIAGMDEAGVDRALIHPVLWDPDFERAGDVEAGSANTRTVLRSWAGSTLTPRTGADPSRIGRSGRGCSACASIQTSGTRNPGSPTAPSIGCGPPPSAPKCRCHSGRRRSCRWSAISPNGTPA